MRKAKTTAARSSWTELPVRVEMPNQRRPDGFRFEARLLIPGGSWAAAGGGCPAVPVPIYGRWRRAAQHPVAM